MYYLKDICVIIATYNRSADLQIAINSFKNKIKELSKVIIIDQSTDDSTKKLIKSFRNNKIKYYHSKIPSLTVARNLGINKISNNSKITIFLDDDTTLLNGYFEEILDVFNKNPKAMGVAGYFLPNIKINKFEEMLRAMFFIEHKALNSAKVYSAYGSVYPSKLDKIIISEWIPGFNMAYKKEVFQKEMFDEKLVKYALAEDFDFSCRINKRYPNSIYITPKANLIHRSSIIERMPTLKLAYMNQINHFYIHYKNFPGFLNQIKFFWTLNGILFLRLIKYFASSDKMDAVKIWFYVKSLLYVFYKIKYIKDRKIDVLYNSVL